MSHGQGSLRRVVVDPADPALDPFRNLTDAQWRRSPEGPDGLFLAESLHVVRRVLEHCPQHVRTVVVTPHAAARLADVLPAAPSVLVAQPALLAAVSGFDVHRGVLAAVQRPPVADPDQLIAGSRRLAVLEDLTDQANLGALFRSASALGIDAILLSPRCADPLYRRTVRVSMGEVLRLAWARLDPWPDGLDRLHRQGFEVLALTPTAAEPLTVPRRAAKVAVLLGSEADGLTRAALAAAHKAVRIPMRPGIDSLNAAAAAAIAFATVGLV